MEEHKVKMWREAALDARLKASTATDATIQRMLMDVAEQYESLIREALGSDSPERDTNVSRG